MSYTEEGITETDIVEVIVSEPGPAVPVAVTGVTLVPETLALTAEGATGTLVETIVPAEATDRRVTWASSAPAVATVDAGVVTPLTAGPTTITVTTVDGSFEDTCVVTVSEFVVELIGIEVDPEEMTLLLNAIGTLEVTAHYNDDTLDEDVTGSCGYGSSNNSIATVEAGEVTAVAEGTTTITVSYTDGDITIEAFVEVTVTESKAMEIIADDLLTFTEGEEFVDGETVGEFTVSLVANSDVDKSILAYFTLPPGTTLEYYDPEGGSYHTADPPGWYPADYLMTDDTDYGGYNVIPTADWEEWVFGPPKEGFTLEDVTYKFRAKFTTEAVGIHPILVGVWEVKPGTPDEPSTPAIKVDLLVYKVITFEVVEEE
ncbi:hypothetical protein ES708_10066 [subsurface metagenome]